MTEPFITFKTVTTRAVKAHLKELRVMRRGGLCISPGTEMTVCGRVLLKDVVDDTVEFVNCGTCLRVARSRGPK